MKYLVLMSCFFLSVCLIFYTMGWLCWFLECLLIFGVNLETSGLVHDVWVQSALNLGSWVYIWWYIFCRCDSSREIKFNKLVKHVLAWYLAQIFVFVLKLCDLKIVWFSWCFGSNWTKGWVMSPNFVPDLGLANWLWFIYCSWNLIEADF